MTAIDEARRLVAHALERPVEEIGQDSALGMAGWDSLGHMRIILSLETRLSRTLAPQEIIGVKSISDISGLISAQNGRLG